MKLSLRAKVGVLTAAVLGLLLFLIVVDLGVNAGRIHYGVSVAQIDVGGMSRAEAVGPLRRRGRAIQNEPLLLTAEGLNVGIPPRCLGWRPAVRESVRDAYDVGRTNAPFGALGDRVGSWLWGIRVDFDGTWSDQLLDVYMDEWDERLSTLGEPLDRDRLTRILREAVAEGDAGPFEFPRESSVGSAMGRERGPALGRREVRSAPVRAPARQWARVPAWARPRAPLALRAPSRVQAELPPGCPDPTGEPFPSGS